MEETANATARTSSRSQMSGRNRGIVAPEDRKRDKEVREGFERQVGTRSGKALFGVT